MGEEVEGFGGGAGEDDFGWGGGIDELGDDFSTLFVGSTGLLGDGIEAAVDVGGVFGVVVGESVDDRLGFEGGDGGVEVDEVWVVLEDGEVLFHYVYIIITLVGYDLVTCIQWRNC